MREPAKTNGQAGFSLVELLIVMMVILTISAIAVPTMMSVVADVRIRSGATTLQGQIQQLRMRAVRDNKTYTARSVVEGGTTIIYLDLDGDSTHDAVEPAVGLPKDVTLAASGNPTTTSIGLPVTDSAKYVAPAATVAINFNSRGLPCTGSAPCSTTKGYAFYMKQTRMTTATAWAAVTVTPAARVRVWRWNGHTWQ